MCSAQCFVNWTGLLECNIAIVCVEVEADVGRGFGGGGGKAVM